MSTAYMNDCEPLLCFAQQVNGYGKAGDVFLGISTSGNSKNILFAATTAHAKGLKVIGLTGATQAAKRPPLSFMIESGGLSLSEKTYKSLMRIKFSKMIE